MFCFLFLNQHLLIALKRCVGCFCFCFCFNFLWYSMALVIKNKKKLSMFSFWMLLLYVDVIVIPHKRERGECTCIFTVLDLRQDTDQFPLKWSWKPRSSLLHRAPYLKSEVKWLTGTMFCTNADKRIWFRHWWIDSLKDKGWKHSFYKSILDYNTEDTYKISRQNILYLKYNLWHNIFKNPNRASAFLQRPQWYFILVMILCGRLHSKFPI